MKIMVTGGNGFIGSNFIEEMVLKHGYFVLNIDKKGDEKNLTNRLLNSKYKYTFLKRNLISINSGETVKIIKSFNPNVIVHFAAETHVDYSIIKPREFLKSNINASFELLEFARKHLNEVKIIHISTDEVYGSIKKGNFKESSKYYPSSPYSASKAAVDHLFYSWNKTYNLKTIITNCTNNFGPYQSNDKLIPKIITSIFHKVSIPIYGKGDNERDWLFVKDHVDAILTVIKFGKIGQTYNIGTKNILSNLDLTKMICDIVDKNLNRNTDSKKLIKFVEDRPGHDFRYSIDPSLIKNQLGWVSKTKFKAALTKTVKWYLENKKFLKKN